MSSMSSMSPKTLFLAVQLFLLSWQVNLYFVDGQLVPSFYHSTEHILDRIRSFANSRPDFFTIEDDDDDFVSVTVSADSDDINKHKLRVLLNFGEHGRELISSEIALALCELFASAKRNSWIHQMLQNVEIVLVPVMCAWSRRVAETTNPCQRTNKAGVDLNRNWDFQFTQNSPLGSEQYAGPNAFSEDESQALRDLAKHFQPHVYVNIHSGFKEMYVGWDYSAKRIPEADHVAMPLLQFLSKHHCHCSFGGGGEIGSYLASGTSMDYMYARLSVPVSLTFELFAGRETDCFKAFNPDNEKEFHTVKDIWTRSLLDLNWFMLNQTQSSPHLSYSRASLPFLPTNAESMLSALPVELSLSIPMSQNAYSTSFAWRLSGFLAFVSVSFFYVWKAWNSRRKLRIPSPTGNGSFHIFESP